METKKLNYPEILKKFTYKPNFKFEIYSFQEEWWIQITMLVEDSTQPFTPWSSTPEMPGVSPYDSFGLGRPPRFVSPRRELIPVSGTYMIPPYLETTFDPEGLFFSFLRDCIQTMELHESDEWFKVDGVAIHDPHKR